MNAFRAKAKWCAPYVLALVLLLCDTVPAQGPSNTAIIAVSVRLEVSGVTADFSASPTRGCAPLDVQFTDESMGEPTSWSWNFGDWETSDEPDPLHTYLSPGWYTVRLTATGPEGTETETKEHLILAQPVVPLVPGNNAVGPMRDYFGMTAQDMLDEINEQGGCATAIYMWQPEVSSWLAHFDAFPPNNFDIENGEGYIIYGTCSSDWCQDHDELACPLLFDLLVGYNFVSSPDWPDGVVTAQGLLDEINAQGGAATAVYTQPPGTDPWLEHLDGGGGTDFALDSGVGYMVYCTAPSIIGLDCSSGGQ